MSCTLNLTFTTRHHRPPCRRRAGPAFLRPLTALIADKNVEQGAATSMYACVAPNLQMLSGQYFSDCDLATPSIAGQDPDKQVREQLWAATEEQLESALADMGLSGGATEVQPQSKVADAEAVPV